MASKDLSRFIDELEIEIKFFIRDKERMTDRLPEFIVLLKQLIKRAKKS